jgi:hypothetical protein
MRPEQLQQLYGRVEHELLHRARAGEDFTSVVRLLDQIEIAALLSPSNVAHSANSGCPAGAPISDLGEALVAVDRLDDRHCRLLVADQKKEGCRAVVDEFVAHGRGSERAHVEFDHGAAA